MGKFSAWMPLWRGCQKAAWPLALGLFATEPLAAAGTESISVRFAMPKSTSIADQYMNIDVLAALLQDQARKLPTVKPCRASILPNDQFSGLDLTAGHPNTAQRVECLRGIAGYLLHASVDKADFLSARKTRAEFTRRLTDPQPRFERSENRAAERLAYLAIYQDASPLHRLHSVTESDIAELSFESFNLWLQRSREEKLIVFDGGAGPTGLLGLPKGNIEPIHLSSPRSPPGVLFFEGERFGVPALLMLSLRPGYVSERLSRGAFWRRFLCNQGIHVRASDDSNAILNITCFSHWIFGDSWVGLAIRKSDESKLPDFCREVKALSNTPEIVTLVRDGTDGSIGLYVLLPSECQRNE